MWEIVNKIAELKSANIDLEAFLMLIGRILDSYNKNITVVNNRIHYEAAYPDWVINKTDTPAQNPANIITYSVVNREPAPLGTKKQLRPIHAADFRNTDTKEIWTLLLMRYGNTVKFDAFAPTATETESLIIRFEKFMDTHIQLIEYIGVERIIYSGRGISMTTQKSGYHNRSALYYMISEEHLWVRTKAINEIAMEYGLADFSERSFEYPLSELT